MPPDHLLMVVAPVHRLGGALGGNLPLILLLVGLLAVASLALAVEVIGRRRDGALVMVAELEAKNVALDAALEERARVERERETLEVRLRAAQRLEAVGKLAGGIAHDFNNLLAVILNYARFVLDDLDTHPSRSDVEEIERAARRAAELTHQLLVFSRQDIVEPSVVDLNAVVAGMDGFLARSLGEDLDLRTTLDADPATVLADRGELEQVVTNLAVNAREAMVEGGGRLEISTDRVEVGTDAPDGDLAPGEYVRLRVADTGIGISPEVLAHVFEPFFTTKDPGSGTGLGLATVYGIATRWGGDARAASDVGHGAVFTVLFPAVTAAVGEVTGAEERADDGAEDGRSADLVLVVEDEPAVRRAACRILDQAGYRVMEAGTGAEALADRGLVRPDLLLTDVVMPGGVSGRELSLRLRERWPDLPVLFMSGYNADIVAQRGVLESGVRLVEKPFTSAGLLAAVGAVLDRG